VISRHCTDTPRTKINLTPFPQVQKINQQVFAGFFAEQFFKTEIGVRIEVFANHLASPG